MAKHNRQIPAKTTLADLIIDRIKRTGINPYQNFARAGFGDVSLCFAKVFYPSKPINRYDFHDPPAALILVSYPRKGFYFGDRTLSRRLGAKQRISSSVLSRSWRDGKTADCYRPRGWRAPQAASRKGT